MNKPQPLPVDVSPKKLLEDGSRCLATTYAKPSILFTHGEGCYIFDAEGNRYLDFTCGIAVNNLGHCHPALVQALQSQAETLFHTSNMFHNAWEAILARKLVDRSFADRVFFANSGTEANEGALKCARAYSSSKYGVGRHEIVYCDKSFHGRSMGSISVTGTKKYQEPFEPLIPGCRAVPFNDPIALKAALTDKTCAFIVEPIQGEGGVLPAEEKYLQEARRLTQEKDILLIFDEVQVGMGRTGKLFAHEHYGIAPDIMTLAKGLGGGFPIGAILFASKVAEVLKPGHHATTFGGNPLACRVASTVIDVIENEGILENASKMGEYLSTKLISLKQDPEVSGHVEGVRGKGLIQGALLGTESTPVMQRLRDQEKVLVNRILPNILRILPPLNVSADAIDTLTEALRRTLKES